MTTLEFAKQNEDWTIAAKLVSKRVFIKKNEGEPATVGLILLFIDVDGALFEIKTWSTKTYNRLKKIFTVYRKMGTDECYSIQPTRLGQPFRPPKSEFSTSKLEFSRGWWIDPHDDIKLDRYIDCHTNIQKSISHLKRGPVNLLGLFMSLRQGPIKYPVNGKPSVQGYFVRLADEEGRVFVALVWHTIRIDKSKFSLFNCKRNDVILLTSARLTTSTSSTLKDPINVTTIYPPLVNSECVSPRRMNALKKSIRSNSESSS